MNKYPVLFGWKVALCESWGLSNYLRYFLQFKYWHLGWYFWRDFLGRKDQVVLDHPYSGVECWGFLQAVPCSFSPVLSPKIQKCLHNWELLCDLLIALLGVQLHVSQVGHLPSLHHWQLFCLRQMACERSTHKLGHCYFFSNYSVRANLMRWRFKVGFAHPAKFLWKCCSSTFYRHLWFLKRIVGWCRPHNVSSMKMLNYIKNHWWCYLYERRWWKKVILEGEQNLYNDRAFLRAVAREEME